MYEKIYFLREIEIIERSWRYISANLQRRKP